MLTTSKIKSQRKRLSEGFVSFVLVEDRTRLYPWSVYIVRTDDFPTLADIEAQLQPENRMHHQVARHHFPEMPERSLTALLTEKKAA